MKKLFAVLLLFPCFLAIAPLHAATDIADDVADPLYLNKLGNFTSQTSIDAGKYFQFREIAGYGFSNRFSIEADIRYRDGGKDDRDGFSNIGVMGKYRAGQGSTGATDILFGFGFGGQGVVPNYSDEVYSIGVRTGKQWSAMTLAFTGMSNWIFHETDGIAYIDLTPEAYFRMVGGWSLGLGATFRKSTTTIYDQEWINLKFGSTVGKTGWFLSAGYEIESKDVRVGGNVNMLF